MYVLVVVYRQPKELAFITPPPPPSFVFVYKKERELPILPNNIRVSLFSFPVNDSFLFGCVKILWFLSRVCSKKCFQYDSELHI